MAKLQYLNSVRRCLSSNVLKIQLTASRYILSEAYVCEEEWKKRLQSPLLKEMQLDQYFLETDKKFGTKRLVSGIDLDLFAISVQDESKLDELEHLLYRFRRTKRSTEIMDSTTYAVVRAFLKFHQYESLFRILNDRDSYGIFPDLCTYNILMSTFLKEKLYDEAAQVATLMMLQEDFSNKISCVLGIASCHMYLKNLCSTKEADVEETEKTDGDEDEEEITYVRVPHLRNPWFDDHFDITNFQHLVGKTCYLLGREIDNAFGRSYQLIGLALYEKWEKLIDLLATFSNSKEATILSESVEKIKSEVEKIIDDDTTTKEKEILEKMTSNSQIEEGDLKTALDLNLKTVLQLQDQDIEAQKSLFSEWENQRQKAMTEQNIELDKEHRLKIIEEKKEYLQWKEKLLFFFENEDKMIEEAKKAEEITEALQKHRSKEVDTYVVPEMVKRPIEKLTKYKRLIRVKKI